MRISKLVTFKVAFIWKLKSLFRSSEEYLEPGRITTMKLLAVNYFRKKAVVDIRLDSKYKFISFFFILIL